MINNKPTLESTNILEDSNMFLKWDLTGEIFKIIKYFSSDKKVLCYSSHYPDQLLLLKDSAFLSDKVHFEICDAEIYARTIIETKNNSSIVNKAKMFAIKHVYDTNHYYGKDDDQVLYTYHLAKVYLSTLKFIHLLDNSWYEEYVKAAAWTHDSIEDHRVTFNDIEKELGKYIAEISFALTNEKGATRKDRANKKYYDDMKEVDFADFLKLMDRNANIEENGNMKKKYKKEMPDFFNNLKNVPKNEDIEKICFEIKKSVQNEKYDEALILIQQKNSITGNGIICTNLYDIEGLKYVDVWKHIDSILNEIEIIHKKGDLIYVYSSIYAYRKKDDFVGGLATISEIKIDENLSDESLNKIMIGIEERPGTIYNYKYLLEKQDVLKEQFGENKAYPDPDLDPEFNNHNADWK